MKKATLNDIQSMLREEDLNFLLSGDEERLVFLVEARGATHPVFLEVDDSVVTLTSPRLPCPDRGSDALPIVEREVLEASWCHSFAKVSRDPEDNELRASYEWPVPAANSEPDEVTGVIAGFLDEVENLIERISVAISTGRTTRERELEEQVDSMCRGGATAEQCAPRRGAKPLQEAPPVPQSNVQQSVGEAATDASTYLTKGDAVLIGGVVSVLGAAGYSLWLACSWVVSWMHETWVSLVG